MPVAGSFPAIGVVQLRKRTQNLSPILAEAINDTILAMEVIQVSYDCLDNVARDKCCSDVLFMAQVKLCTVINTSCYI